MKESVKYSDILSFDHVPKYVWDLIFVFLFIVISVGFNYHEIMFKRPQGVHVWRQTDCASMALNYHQKDLPLLHPRMHFKLNDKSEALGEFPIMYYCVGKLYSIFGYHEFIYRFLWYFIAFIGSFCLFRLAYLMLNLPIESLFIGLMLFVSPVVAFYAIGFISDPIALFIIPVSLYLLHRAFVKDNYGYFLTATMVIALAGILRISSLIIPMAIFGTYFLFSILNKKWKNSLLVFLGLTFILLVNFAWYDYAIRFNASNDTGYFLMRIVPFWELGESEKSNLFKILTEDRLPEIYNNFMLLLTAVLTIMALLKRRLDIWISTFVFTAIAGLVFYSLLFFQQFRYHDYYMVNAVIIIPLLFIVAFQGIKDLHLRHNLSFTIKIVFVIIMIRNTVLAANFVKRRYIKPENEFYISRGYGTIEPYLKEIGVEMEDYVISIPDASPNTTLYLMNRQGWSNLYHDPMQAENIEMYKKMGAKYLIIGDKEILKDSLLSPYLKRPIGQYKEIVLYKL